MITDLLIVIFSSPFFISQKRSFTYHLINAGGLFVGYSLGLFIFMSTNKNIGPNNTTGYGVLYWMLGLAITARLAIMLVRFIIKKTKRKNTVKTELPQQTTTQPTFYRGTIYHSQSSKTELKPKADKHISLKSFFTKLSYKIPLFITGIFLLSQTLPYVPILGVQFSAQGSGFIMAAIRFFPDTIISNTAQKMIDGEFAKIDVSFDPGPIKGSPTTESDEFKSALERIAPSVVRVAVVQCGGLRGGLGSGAVVAPGFIVTNEHVATGASSIYVVSRDGLYPATPVIIDGNYDVAVLYSKYIDLEPIPISTDEFKSGIEAMSLGYPGGSEDLKTIVGTTSSTTIKSIQTKLDSDTSFELSAGLGKGSSGGPVINSKGEIIGINSGGGGGAALLAVKANVVKKAVEDAQNKPFPAFNIGCQYTRSSY